MAFTARHGIMRSVEGETGGRMAFQRISARAEPIGQMAGRAVIFVRPQKGAIMLVRVAIGAIIVIPVEPRSEILPLGRGMALLAFNAPVRSGELVPGQIMVERFARCHLPPGLRMAPRTIALVDR